MAQTHVISALADKRSELLGLIEFKRKELEKLSQNLVHIDGAIQLFEPDFDIQSIKPLRPQTQNRIFITGESQRLILDALRGTQGLVTIQIVKHIMQRKGLDDAQLKEVNNSVDKSLRYLEKKGLLTHSKSNGHNLWSVV